MNLDKLHEWQGKAPSDKRGVTAAMARDRYQNFDPKVRQTVQKISEYLVRNKITMN